MSRRVPPLNPLYAFEVAARHGSFTLAADELHVTQGAVSRQVRTLEQYLGIELFERSHRSVRLTRAGRSFHDDLKAGFDRLEAATGRLTANRTRQTLIVRAYSTFASRWLIPRLGAFREANPKVSVDLTASIQPVDFEREDVDIAVHFGTIDERSGLHHSLLFPVAIVPVCSPVLINSRRPLRRPSDLQNYTLLHTLVRPDDWRKWLGANGVSAEWATHGYRFESSSMAYDAAINGIGVAIAVTAFVEDDLKDGRLVVPFPMNLSTPDGYWVVHPPRKTANPAVVVFRDWIIEEAKYFNKQR